MITVQYKIFPFKQLRAIKQIAFPSEKPSGKPVAKLSRSYSTYYFDKKSFFEQHGGHQYDAVFIGGSITDAAEWEDLFPSLKIANRGISGDTTIGVLKRLDSIYSSKAAKAFIMIGINDISIGLEIYHIVENYKRIINKLNAHGMHVYIQSTILAGKRKTGLNMKIIALNELLKKISDENEKVTYIDLNIKLSKDSHLSSNYSTDGVHLNGSGYDVWKNLIKDYLL
jgi:lysophospholipase L1-like esterase